MRKIQLDTNLIIEKYNNGKTAKEIADILKVSKRTILDRLKELKIETRSSGRRKIDIKINQKFGLLTVSKLPLEKSKHLKYICICECGKETTATSSELIRGRQCCWDCRGALISNSKWKGYGEISGEFWDRTKKSAKIRNYSFNITIDECWELFLKQDRKCALSGVDLVFHRSNLAKTTASIDRIDSSKGYDKNNIQWVHKTVNNIKMDLDENEFINWCTKIANYKNDITKITRTETD